MKEAGVGAGYGMTDVERYWFEADGYLVVPGVVEPQLCDSIAAETWERLDSFFGLKPGSFSSSSSPATSSCSTQSD